MASQNLTAEHYHLEMEKTGPSVDQYFSDCISTLKTMFDRWLQLLHVTSNQRLYDLVIKNKVYQSCNTNLVSLQEPDPPMLTELTKLGEQYCSAHPNSIVKKDVPLLLMPLLLGLLLDF